MEPKGSQMEPPRSFQVPKKDQSVPQVCQSGGPRCHNGIPRSPKVPQRRYKAPQSATTTNFKPKLPRPGARRRRRRSAAPGFSLPLGVLELPSRYPYQGSPKGSPPPSCTPLPPAFRHQHISKKGPGNQAGKMIAKICKKVAQGHPRVPNQTKSTPKMTP